MSASTSSTAATKSPTDLDPHAWKFPKLKTVATGPLKKGEPHGPVYYGAYFYPFTKPGDDPVFAVVGGPEVIVARPDEKNGIEVIQYFTDDGAFEEAYCTACWSRDRRTGDPLLAVGGQGRVVKILNIRTGKVVQTLSGHGDEIMEIIVHPCNQDIIVSAAADHAVRFWSIDPKHRNQPCLMMCAGEGHRETILSIAFHASGRYLLSGGMDHLINLWVIPGIPDEPTDKPVTLIYPHFSSSMVHSNYIDCLKFHGDFILSKAASESKIVLWTIQNFTSKIPPPAMDKAPTTHEWRDTRSAFGGTFERILQFSIPDTDLFFMRFGFFEQPHMHPILMMGSVSGKLYMWDLTMIEDYSKGAGLDSARDKISGESAPPDRTSPSITSAGKVSIKRDDVGELFSMVKPHHTMDIQKLKSTIRHIAFSLDGRYVVIVGEHSSIAICER